ncbi:MAG TPA: hypothetical protein EYG85_10485 [Crocinitomix sp.]|nr:hypothetical protein [Crocinitomix sp.]
MKASNIFLRFFLISIFFSTILFASQGTRVENVMQASGYGISKSAAIQNALVEAVKQKNGAYVESVKGVFSSYAQSSVSVNNDSVHATKIDDAMVQKIRIATNGYIDGYKVIDIVKHESDYEAIIEVITVAYKTPGNSAHKRRKIVIVPSYTENIAFGVMGELKNIKAVSYNLTQELTNSITQTRKFSVLDRSNKNAYSNEKKMIISADAHKDEILKLGQVLGTDYLVVSTIKEFKITNKTTKIKSIDKDIKKLKAYARVHYKILTMATRQIKWSNTIDFEFVPKGNATQQIFYNTLKRISTELTRDIIDNIYPLRVAKISGNGDAIIMQSTKLGTVYDVFAMGEKLFDPYTKEFLGYDEIKTGKIRIVRSLSKVSYGEVLEGEIQKNSICRKSKYSSKKLYAKKKNSSIGNEDKKNISNSKKSIAIQSLSISSNIDKYKYKYIKDSNIEIKIKNLVNKSKKYKVLTRDKEQAQALMDENELSKSELSDEMDEDSMKLSNVEYQLLPKVTKFKISTASKKIPNVSAYDNSDYIKMELNVVVIDRKGEVVFESTKSDTFTQSWGSQKKLKRTKPSYNNVSKLADKIVANVLYDLLNKKSQMMNKKFITVVDVDKKTIYLDLGDNEDIEEGDTFPVYKEPIVKTIKRTGKTRLSYGDKIATVKIDGIYEDGAEAIVIKGKISNIKEGYVLRIKKRRK